MRTQKENLLEMLAGKPADGIVNGWQPFSIIWDELLFTMASARPGDTVVDPWGVTITWGKDQPGPMPLEDNIVCPNVREWKSCVKALDIANMTFDWTNSHGQIARAKAEGKIATGFMPIGVFELIHNLLGFENALVSFLDEPEALHELIEYIVDFRMEYLKHVVEHMKPEAMLIHDDWGTKTSMFMSPESWREFFKPGYERMYRYLKENGIITIHHADSYLEPIVKEMEEIGIDIWQGVLPQNDISRLKKELPGNMLFMGGLDAGKIDRSDCCEETIRAEVRRACEEYTPGGRFIPCITYGAPGAIFPGVDDIIYDEVERFQKELF